MRISKKLKRDFMVAFFIILGVFSYLLFRDYIKERLNNNAEVKNEYNCSDFKTQKEAQVFFISQGGPEEDPYSLDKNKDGKACEDLP